MALVAKKITPTSHNPNVVVIPSAFGTNNAMKPLWHKTTSADSEQALKPVTTSVISNQNENLKYSATKIDPVPFTENQWGVDPNIKCELTC
jgi:hypothetical protein